MLSGRCWRLAASSGPSIQCALVLLRNHLAPQLPDPCIGDIILFVHIATFIAAVACRPHRPASDRKILLDTFNFLMLLIWWIFLYAFIVFPDQYVSLNVCGL